MSMKAGSSAKVMKKAGSNHIYTRSIDIAWWYGETFVSSPVPAATVHLAHLVQRE